MGRGRVGVNIRNGFPFLAWVQREQKAALKAAIFDAISSFPVTRVD